MPATRRQPGVSSFRVVFRPPTQHTSASRMHGLPPGRPARALLDSDALGARRCARLEWILRLAALAFPMAQDTVDDARVGNR